MGNTSSYKNKRYAEKQVAGDTLMGSAVQPYSIGIQEYFQEVGGHPHFYRSPGIILHSKNGSVLQAPTVLRGRYYYTGNHFY